MTWTKERATVAALSRHHPGDTEALDNARRNLKAARLEDYVRNAVETAPPLTDEQRDRLARILRGNGAPHEA